MISDEQLNQFRLSGEKVRVKRDMNKENDVRGIVVAWNEDSVMIRKSNRNIVKLSRNYSYEPARRG